MYLVNQITSNAKQRLSLVLPDGTFVVLHLAYKPLQFGWFITNLTYKDFQLNNVRLVTSPNILHQYLNQLPFGIAVFVTDNQEATQLKDFSSGRATMYLLDSSETALYKDILEGIA